MGSFDLHLHLHTGAVVDGVELPGDEEFEPSMIQICVPPPPYSRPAASEWDFVGVGAGGNVWILPESQIGGVPFLGISSEELDAGDWVGDIVWSVNAIVSGPPGGQVSIWQNDLFGPAVKVSSADGLPDSFATITGSHGHYNYGFTAPGLYQIEFQALGIHATDGTVTGSAVFNFLVKPVPEPGSLTLFAVGAAALAPACRRRHGAERQRAG